MRQVSHGPLTALFNKQHGALKHLWLWANTRQLVSFARTKCATVTNELRAASHMKMHEASPGLCHYLFIYLSWTVACLCREGRQLYLSWLTLWLSGCEGASAVNHNRLCQTLHYRCPQLLLWPTMWSAINPPNVWLVVNQLLFCVVPVKQQQKYQSG